jgi:hypothetical protein
MDAMNQLRHTTSGFIYDANTGGISQGHIFEAILGPVKGAFFIDVSDKVRKQRLLTR